MNRVISSAVKVQKSIFLFVLLFCLSKVFSLKKDGKFSSLVFELSLICSMIVNLASLLKTWLVLNFDSVLSCVVHTVAMAIQMNFQFSVLPMYCIFHFWHWSRYMTLLLQQLAWQDFVCMFCFPIHKNSCWFCLFAAKAVVSEILNSRISHNEP